RCLTPCRQEDVQADGLAARFDRPKPEPKLSDERSRTNIRWTRSSRTPRAASGHPPLVMQPGERLEVRAELRVNSGEADPCASNHELSKPASHALTEVAALRPELILIAPTVEAGDRSGLRELTMQGHSAGKPMLRQKLGRRRV